MITPDIKKRYLHLSGEYKDLFEELDQVNKELFQYYDTLKDFHSKLKESIEQAGDDVERDWAILGRKTAAYISAFEKLLKSYSPLTHETAEFMSELKTAGDHIVGLSLNQEKADKLITPLETGLEELRSRFEKYVEELNVSKTEFKEIQKTFNRLKK